MMDSQRTASRHDHEPIEPFEGGDAPVASNAESSQRKQRHYLLRSQTVITKEKGYYRGLFAANCRATLTYCAVFWTFGICVGFLGPTLWDLGCITGTSFSTMTSIFLSQTLFICFGSMLETWFLNRFTANPILLVGVCVIIVTLVMIPLVHGLLTLAIILAIMGFNMGLIDTTANVSMIKLYGQDVSPFLQAMHFFYGFGAFLSPITIDPFIDSSDDCSKFLNNATAGNWMEDVLMNMGDPGVMSQESQSLEEAQSKVKVQYAFWIMAALQIPVAALVYSLLAKEKKLRQETANAPPPNWKQQSIDNANAKIPLETSNTADGLMHRIFSWCVGSCCSTHPRSYIVVIALTCVLLFFADGIQAGFSGLIFTFAKVHVHMVAQNAAALNACFWGMFALGRLLAIVAAVHFTPYSMLLFDITGAMVSMLLMSVFNHSAAVMYVGAALFGLFLSNVYPSAISFAEQFVDITSSATSCIVVAAAAGESLYPVIIGRMFGTTGMLTLMVFGNITMLLMAAAFFFLWISGQYAQGDTDVVDFLSSYMPRVFAKPTTERESLIDNDFLHETYGGNDETVMDNNGLVNGHYQ